MKKSLLIASLMAAVALAACGKKEEAAAPEASAPAAAAPAAPAASDAAAAPAAPGRFGRRCCSGCFGRCCFGSGCQAIIAFLARQKKPTFGSVFFMGANWRSSIRAAVALALCYSKLFLNLTKRSDRSCRTQTVLQSNPSS